MARLSLVASLILFIVLGFSVHTVAQSAPPTQISPSNETGTNPYGTYSTGGGDVSLSNGNLSLQIPLVTLPGRNGHNFVLAAQYDSKIWTPNAFFAGPNDLHYNWQAEQKFTGMGTLAWHLNWPTLQQGPVLYDQSGTFVGYGDYILTLQDGSKHHLGARFSPQDSEDGAYLRIASNPSSPSTSLVTQKDGTTIHFPAPTSSADKIEDTNGNYISPNANGYIDSVGRQITLTKTGNNITQISYLDSNGTQQAVTLNYTTITLLSTTAGQYFTGATPFALPVSNNCTGNCQRHIFVSPAPVNYTVTLLTSIVLPNGKSYTLTYNGYGEITKITFPTGGYVAYDYAAFTHLETYWSSHNLNIGGDFREVTKRHVCRNPSGVCGGSGTPEDITTFTPTISNTTPGNTKMDVIDPLGYKNHYEFSGVAQDLYTPYSSSRETLHQIYSPTSTLLRTIATTYANLPVECATCPTFPLTVTTTLNDTSGTALVSKMSYVYDTYTANVTRPFYNPDNGIDYTQQSGTTITSQVDNPTQVLEYDYGSGVPPASPLRKNNATWLHVQNSVDYTNTLHIMDLKTDAQVLDASNNKLSETQYEYDSYTEGLTASGAVQHDSAYNAGNNYLRRGNLTAISRWKNDGTFLTTRFQYDDAGNARKATDPRGDSTTMSYADSWATGGGATCSPVGGNATAYLSSVTNPLSQTTSAKYNSCSGTMASYTDLNSQTTNYTYDLLDHQTSVLFPDTGQTTDCYSDVPGSSCYTASPPFQMVRTTKIATSPTALNLITTSIVDGLGRVTQTQLNSDPQGVVYTDTTYDGRGRKLSVSNPYRSTSSSTDGITTYQYDALDRVTQVAPPDGTVPTSGSTCLTNNVCTSYAGNLVTTTDQAGKKRKNQTDALGRLTAVWEDPTTLNYETDYQYDVLDDLLRVDQKGGDANSANWRTRTFTYDSFSRVLTANNPESGTITYKYDADTNCSTPNSYPSLLISKIDARSIRTCLQYDVLDRATQKNYSNGDSAVAYSYDSGTNGIGRRTGMTDASGSSNWTYEVMGRVASESHTISGISKTISNFYNLDGSIKQITYPTGSGSILAYTYNAAGRLTTLQDTAHSVTFFQNTSYFPSGQLNQATFGSAVETSIYNARLQPCWFYVTTGTVLSANTLCNGTASSANLLDLKYSFGFGINNNGNVLGVTNNKDSNRSVSYGYDALNRIASSATPNADCSAIPTNPSLTKNWGESFTIDPWGNLTNRTVTKCSADPLSVTVLTNNRLSGFGYDAAGNMTSNGGANYTYNAEGQLATAGGVTYTYDGDGNRVKKSNGTLYWGSGPLLESDLSGSLQREFVFAGGARIARRDISGGAVYYYFTDHLQSSDVVTNSAGVIQNESDYYPYGGERAYLTNLANQNYKFTGKERDSESGLDEFGARYYANALGRFMIADWAVKPTNVPYANFGNPQSLNLYSYVQNNPTTLGDPDGHQYGLELLEEVVLDHPEQVAKVLHGIEVASQGAEDVLAQGAKELGSAVTAFNVASMVLLNPQPLGGGDTLHEHPFKETEQEQAPEPEPSASGDGARKKGRGGESDAAKEGREKHAAFREKVKSKPGWQSEPSLIDPATGKTVKPDAVTPSGRPVELKPNTKSGKAAGKTQLKAYQRATGKKGRVVYHKKKD